MKTFVHFEQQIPSQFYWLNEPQEYSVAGGLHITTDPETDFWQRTHYGFNNDNGHCLLTRLQGDFQITTCVRFDPQNRYDQCGLIVRLDSENWIKTSTEYIDSRHSQLGSVVTSLCFSDWATTEISSEIRRMCYRISRRGDDFLLQNSYDGQKWQQLRITHLLAAEENLQVGVYACSPMNGRFQCTFEQISIAENEWPKP